jgi:hypothetical protein
MKKLLVALLLMVVAFLVITLTYPIPNFFGKFSSGPFDII